MSEKDETKAFGEAEPAKPDTAEQHFEDIAEQRKAFQAGIEFGFAKLFEKEWLRLSGETVTKLYSDDAFEHWRSHSNDTL
jgi:hypothetical protein